MSMGLLRGENRTLGLRPGGGSLRDAQGGLARMGRWLVAVVLMFAASTAAAQDGPGAVLIFSHTSGYRHDSIPAGNAAMETIARDRGLASVTSEDPSVFSEESLSRFSAIVFMSATTDPSKPESEWLTGDRRAALQQFVARGGGILAVHAAADSHYGWDWYGKLIGGRFASHPAGTPQGTVSVFPDRHANDGLPPTVERADEWYYFNDLDPCSDYLMTVDPASIGARDVNPNPVAWTREIDGGRVFYTAMGHTKESYAEPFFLRHLANGLDWVLSRGPEGHAPGTPGH
jgi:type 1 glutamine amidotransferase